jgi:hypothetical protein
MSGGSVTESRAESEPQGGEFHLDSSRGKFTVYSTEARGLIGGIGSTLNALTADQANRARECMRPYISQIMAIVIGEGSEAPPAAENSKLTGVPVVYYLKSADGDEVTNALKRRGIKFTQLASVLPSRFRTTGIRCGLDTPAEAIKELALTLTDSGIPVRAINRIRSHAKNILYLTSLGSEQSGQLLSTPLTKGQINAITGCPAMEDKFIANFTPFWRPRATDRTPDSRYVDVWPDGRQGRDPGGAARLFCTQRGFREAVFWASKHVTDDGAAAIRLGDNSVCRGDCEVLSSVFCQ